MNESAMISSAFENRLSTPCKQIQSLSRIKTLNGPRVRRKRKGLRKRSSGHDVIKYCLFSIVSYQVIVNKVIQRWINCYSVWLAPTPTVWSSVRFARDLDLLFSVGPPSIFIRLLVNRITTIVFIHKSSLYLLYCVWLHLCYIFFNLSLMVFLFLLAIRLLTARMSMCYFLLCYFNITTHIRRRLFTRSIPFCYINVYFRRTASCVCRKSNRLIK